MIASHFTEDDNHQLSVRYDDILIDSRKSPAVVLDTDKSNPWAIAHLANHPPKSNKPKSKPSSTTFSSTYPSTSKPISSNPNCRPLPINYTSEMNLSKDMKKFVPNRYARKPALLGYNEAFERQDVYMHGLILVTTRDVENEELFFDYRFNYNESHQNQHPDWYHVCDEEGTKNRWG